VRALGRSPGRRILSLRQHDGHHVCDRGSYALGFAWWGAWIGTRVAAGALDGEGSLERAAWSLEAGARSSARIARGR
jgi:sterol desaturase/sphingolipid hydroxylase (fatty acid hydroxylase superfamily)